jgi:hypothetical protein
MFSTCNNTVFTKSSKFLLKKMATICQNQSRNFGKIEAIGGFTNLRLVCHWQTLCHDVPPAVQQERKVVAVWPELKLLGPILQISFGRNLRTKLKWAHILVCKYDYLVPLNQRLLPIIVR